VCLYGVADRSGLSLEIVSTTAAGKLFGFGKSAEPRHRSGAHEWPDDKWRKRPLPAVRQAPPLRTMLALVAAVRPMASAATPATTAPAPPVATVPNATSAASVSLLPGSTKLSVRKTGIHAQTAYSSHI